MTDMIQTKTNSPSLEKILREYPVKTFPKLGQFIVTDLAFQSRKQAVKRVSKSFILRNKHTTRNILFVKSPRTKKLAGIKSSYGATDKASYMKDQEEGTTLKPKKGTKLAIPTKLARRSDSIKKLKKGKFKMSSIGTIRKTSEMRGKTKRQRTIALMQDMARKRQTNRLALLPFPNKPGIYKIINAGKERIGSKTKFKMKLRQIYDLSKRQLTLKPSRWMEPVNKGVNKNQTKIAERAFQKFIKVIK